MLKIIAYLSVVLTLSVADEELVSYFRQFFRKSQLQQLGPDHEGVEGEGDDVDR